LALGGGNTMSDRGEGSGGTTDGEKKKTQEGDISSAILIKTGEREKRSKGHIQARNSSKADVNPEKKRKCINLLNKSKTKNCRGMQPWAGCYCRQSKEFIYNKNSRVQNARREGGDLQ